MFRGRRALGLGWLGWVLGVALASSLGGQAGAQESTRTETLRWSHPQPSSVDGFRVYYGSSSGNYDQSLDVRIPGTDGSGNFVYDLRVPADQVVYVAVTAYAELESGFSNEKVSEPPAPPPSALGQPGRPQPVLN